MRRILGDDTIRVRFVSTGKAAAHAKYAKLSDGSRKRVADAQDTNEPGWHRRNDLRTRSPAWQLSGGRKEVNARRQ